MLLAYIDEIGEPGAFIAKDHPRFKTSPAFGYAGFVIDSARARQFGAAMVDAKRNVFKTEMARAANPAQWERKGSSIFRPDTYSTYPQQIRVFNGLVRQLRVLQGRLFYYADEKPLGTPAQTSLNTVDRETIAMRESLNRLARYADSCDENILVMIDQINENQRSERVPNMYGHILGRASDYREMRRIIEPPMHIDSILSANIQFSDWVAACVTRAIEYHLISDSPYGWVAGPKAVDHVRGAFTHESKLHLWKRSVQDFNHSDVFKKERPIYPAASGQLLSSAVDPSIFRRIKAAAEKAQQK